MHDRTNHNLLAEQFAARLREPDPAYVASGVARMEAFERRASGLANPFSQSTHPSRPTTAAKVASEGTSRMSLLQPAISSSAFLKAGVLGFQGGGKTLTSAKCLIGLYKYTQELGLNDGSKPVAMLDTEKGSDWLIPIFKEADVPFVVAKRKTFSDLLNVMDEAESEAFGLLIDSVTHPWRELVESYLRKKDRSYLAMDDWNYLKGEHGWQKFTDRFVNSKLHIVMAGRAGYEYENYVEDGRKKMEKVGTKMKAEGETGYEPDLLILMEQHEDLRTGKVVHRATVQKDRSTLLDGMQFDNPDFSDFLPHVQRLALGSIHIGVGATGDSQHLLKLQKRDWEPVQREICCDEIQTLLAMHYPSQTADDKKARLKAMLTHFNATWTEIEKVMPLCDLRAGYDSLYQALEGKPSKYASAIAKDNQSNDINDSLPDFAPLKDITLSPELLASRIVVEAAKVAAPIEPAFDESRWLADLTKAFDDCMDFVSFGQKQQAIMIPAKPLASPPTWAKALKLAKRCTSRLLDMDTEPQLVAAAVLDGQPEFAVAAG